MSSTSDIMYRNHAVAKTAKDAQLDGEDRVIVQFSRLVVTSEGKKYIRADVNFGMTQFKEVIKTYGLELTNRWKIWQAGTEGKKGKNVPYIE